MRPPETYGLPDAENPEWTKEKLARSLSFSELQAAFQQALKRGKRGPQKAREIDPAPVEGVKPNR